VPETGAEGVRGGVDCGWSYSLELYAKAID
jgi:hypothetical protein